MNFKLLKDFRNFVEKKPVQGCFAISLLITFLIELLSKRSLIKLFLFIVTRPHIFLLNALIIFWSFSLVLLVHRKWFLGMVISIFWLILGCVDFGLLGCRVTPFNFSDLRLTKDALLVAGKYLKWYHVVLLIIGIIALIAFLILMFRKLPKENRRFKLRRIRALIISAFLMLAVVGINSLCVSFGVIESTFGNLAEAYQEYGFVYCFCNSIVNTGVKKPSDYSEEVVEEIAEEKSEPESKVDTTTVVEPQPDLVDDTTGIEATEETPNIIFLQLESFSDPTLYTHCKVSEDPIPYFHQLMSEYSSGYYSVPAVGAGTANTEFESITGMNMDLFGPGEYPYKTIISRETCESMAYDMKELGYHAHAIHNNSATFYNRYKVFSNLGFDTFTSLEYMRDYDTTYMGWAKDSILIPQIEKSLDSTHGADYIYTISVQGHGSYPTEKVIEDPEITVTGLESEEKTNQMEYYIQQIHEMDSFVKDLIEMLTERDEPTILVMYGDHLPSLNLTADKLENGNEFQTEYVIWDNIGLEKQDKDLEAYQMAAYIQSRLGISQGTMFRFHQTYLEEETHTEDEEQEYLDDMQVLQYDMLYGKQDVYNGDSPYTATDLHFGISEIRITQATVSGDGLYLLGYNFTPNSVVSVNGKTCETANCTENMIYTTDFKLDKGDNEITVQQISDDNIVLSETDAYIITKNN